MKTDRTDDLGLPDELVTRMRRLAETGTAGSRPFPRVDTAIRRSRITRYGGVALAGAVATLVIAVEVFAGGAIDRADQQGVPSAPRPVSSSAPATPFELENPPSTPKEAGYPEKTVGSLSGDETWLASLREQLHDPTWRHDGMPAIATGDIQVVAAGDIDDRARYAVTVFHWKADGKTYWSRGLWVGRASASADQMEQIGSAGVPTEPDTVPYEPLTVFVAPSGNLAKAVVVAVAPTGVDSAAVTTSRAFVPRTGALQASIRRTEVTRIEDGPGAGAVWAGPVTEDEYRISEIVLSSDEGDIAGGTTLTRAPGFDLTAVAEADTKTADLESLNGSTGEYRMSTAEVPVLAAGQTANTGTELESRAAVVVFRAAGGVYLAGFTLRTGNNGVALPTVTVRHGSMQTVANSNGAAMLGTVTTTADGDRKVLMLVVPENTRHLTIGSHSIITTRESRFLVLSQPNDDSIETATGELKVVAKDEDGNVLGEITPETLDSSNEEVVPTSDFADYGDGTSVRP